MDADEYADLRAALDYADLALGSGDGTGALDQAEQVIARLDGRSPDDLLPAARLITGRALVSIGRTTDAIPALERVATDRDPGLNWARAAMSLTWCYREIGALDKSVAMGEQTLQALRDAGLGESDDSIRLQVTVAAAYFMQGDTRHAMRMCRRAIEIADRTGSLEAQASAYWNTCVFESQEGAAEAAVPLARHAISLFEQTGNHAYAAQLRGMLGISLLRQDPPDVEAAIPVLEQAARELAWSRSSAINLADTQVSLARARLLSGDLDGAEQLLEATFHTPVAAEAPFLKASALALRGQIHALRGAVTTARDSYRSAVLELTAMGADRQAAKLWFELGTLLVELGEPEAHEAFKRAAAATGKVGLQRRRFLSPG